jgi:hypothetical protein
MAHSDSLERSHISLSRRGAIGALTVGAAAMAAGAQAATSELGPVAPPSTVTAPPRDFGPKARAPHDQSLICVR